MNSDGRDSALNSHICFNALATLQHIKNVENCKLIFMHISIFLAFDSKKFALKGFLVDYI